jgi:hypothetical protein
MLLPSCAAGWALLPSILIDMFNRSLEQRCACDPAWLSIRLLQVNETAWLPHLQRSSYTGRKNTGAF